MTGVVSRTKQRVVTGILGVGAMIAFALAVAYPGEELPDDLRPNSLPSAADAPGDDPDGSGGAVATSDSSIPASPIEAFLPRSGQASACREPVGVDLRVGYGATLTINGVAVAPEEMNVVLDDEGNPTDEQTASRSLGQYTFGPEEDCPNGRILRATDNVLQACVYRLEDGPDNCAPSENRFDVL